VNSNVIASRVVVSLIEPFLHVARVVVLFPENGAERGHQEWSKTLLDARSSGWKFCGIVLGTIHDKQEPVVSVLRVDTGFVESALGTPALGR
jgi:hypothetical protein